jgi:hypothetical protein
MNEDTKNGSSRNRKITKAASSENRTDGEET